MAEDGKVRGCLSLTYFELAHDCAILQPRFALGVNVSSIPVPSDPESLIQPGLSLRNYAEELEGELTIPTEPRLSGGYADIYQGQWKRPDSVEVEVAVKVFKQVWPKSVSVDTAVVKERVEKVG